MSRSPSNTGVAPAAFAADHGRDEIHWGGRTAFSSQNLRQGQSRKGTVSACMEKGPRTLRRGAWERRVAFDSARGVGMIKSLKVLAGVGVMVGGAVFLATGTAGTANSWNGLPPAVISPAKAFSTTPTDLIEFAPGSDDAIWVGFGPGPHSAAVDQSTHLVYVTEFQENSVLVIDPATAGDATKPEGKPVSVPVGEGPTGVAVDSSARLVYVANMNGGSVSVIDARALSVTATIPVGQAPLDVAVDEGSHVLYVANYASDSISVIDTRTRVVTNTLKGGGGPSGLALDSTANLLYAINRETATVSVYDTVTGRLTATIETSAMVPSSVGLDPDSQILLVGTLYAEALAQVDLSEQREAGIYELACLDLVFDPTTHAAWVAGEEGTLFVIDAARGTVVGSATIEGEDFSAVAFDDELATAYVVSHSGLLWALKR